MQRLEELMQWQRQQQGKLLRHQEEQKAQISLEQKRLLQDIGLVLKEPLIADNYDKTKQEIKCGAVSIDEREDKVSQQKQKVTFSFDETPVQQVNKSFNELLQEKLAGNEPKENASLKPKPKKTFLRKGEGLARFRMSYDVRTREFKPMKGNSNSKPINENAVRKVYFQEDTVPSMASLKTLPNSRKSVPKSPDLKKQPTNLATWSQTLQKALHLSPKTCIYPRELEESNSKNEQDELRVFELLEQQAANSSFCSTSSVVEKFLGEPAKFNSNKEPSSYQPPQSAFVRNVKSNLHNVIHFPVRHSHHQVNELAHKNKSQELNVVGGLCSKALGNQKDCHTQREVLVGDEYFYQSHLQMNNDGFKTLNSDIPCSKMKENTELDCKRSDVKYRHLGTSGNERQLNEEGPSRVRPVNHGIVQPPPVDTFQDSQAWSDCSYSSSDETVSGNETPVPHKKEQNFSENSNKPDVQGSLSPHRDSITFKSALLKERLMELENEIDIFKRENANLCKLKKQYEDDIMNFNKEKKEYEKLWKENTEKMQDSIIAERKKLAREKQVFEKYCKDVKKQPTRQEREEIKVLKQQIADLQEELIKKDQRWSATQVRTRDRMRQLNQQISQLKEENERLKAEKAKIKKVRFYNPNVISRTKVLHSLNDKLGKLKMEDLESPIVIKNVVPRKKIPTKVLTESVDKKESELFNSNFVCPPVLKSVRSNIERRDISSDSEGDCMRDDPNFEKDSTDSEIVCTSSEAHVNAGASASEILIYDSFFPVTGREFSQSSKNEEENKIIHVQGGEKTTEPEEAVKLKYCNEKLTCNTLSESNSLEAENMKMTSSHQTLNSKSNSSSIIKKVGFVEDSMNNNSVENRNVKTHANEIIENSLPDGSREKMFPDGRREIWYPNGNVKKLSADNLITKMIYYNGDVKEKHHADGTEKYYYAETKAWQTSYSDGREILEFPDGQIECKMPNGQSQITYPNGCSLLKNVDGSEEWALADGTIVKKNVSGVQELYFPNGQKEIHTSEHKRREYPDGTVKYIYPDGVQETRYASGRVRLKDKDGNLIMDSAVR